MESHNSQRTTLIALKSRRPRTPSLCDDPRARVLTAGFNWIAGSWSQIGSKLRELSVFI
jgi:hypothetical protein